jgi:SulP family sulfate permease
MSPQSTAEGHGRDGAGHTAASLLQRFLPFLGWFKNYSIANLQADLIAGVTVALVLIPQSMAYAQLADLPAYYGLYAAFLPPIVAALFGSSRQLATGPVAIVSLMTATALAPLATAGSEQFIAYAVLLAFLVGLFQFLLGVFRLGMVVNFLSHPVVNGFTNAAAIIIATSQLPKLFGVEVDKAEHHYETVYRTVVAAIHEPHPLTLGIGLLAFFIMWGLKRVNPKIPNVLVAVLVTTVISWWIGFEKNLSVPLAAVADPAVQELAEEYDACLAEVDARMAERIETRRKFKEAEKEHGKHSLAAIELRADVARSEIAIEEIEARKQSLRRQLRGLEFVAAEDGADGYVLYQSSEFPAAATPLEGHWRLKVGNQPLGQGDLTMMGGGMVVGNIPRGLPGIKPPRFEFGVMRDLFPMAIIISLLGFMEAISIAKAMANRTGQRLDPNQELIGQGLGNLVGSFAMSYPVSGSFSRSAVNIQAGAVSGLSSVFSVLVVVTTLLFLTPLLYHLPQSVLAAIIMMAVIGLVNIKGFVHAWHAQKYDGIISGVSFVGTLAFAPHLDKGIIIGVVLSLGLFLLRNMRPATTVLSRTPDGHYRSAERWGLQTCKHVAVIRFNNSLIFANVNHLETEVLREVSQRPELRHILLVGNGINELDSSGEVMISFLVSKLRMMGIDVSFTGLNENVLDVLKRTQVFQQIGEHNFYGSVEKAVDSIHGGVCLETKTTDCPLLRSPIYGRSEEN